MDNSALAQVAAPALADKLTHVMAYGAGVGSGVLSRFRKAAAHVVVVDPLDVAGSEQGDAAAGLTIHAHSGLGENDRFNMYNLGDIATARPPTGLLTLFPGARVSDETQLALLPVSVLTDPLEGQDDTLALLFLGVTGDEGDILQFMHDHKTLSEFAWIVVALPKEPLFEGALAGTDLVRLLDGEGYQIVRQDLSDPDCPLALFRRDDTMIDAHAQIAKLKQDLQASERWANSEKDGALERISGLEKQCGALREELAMLRETLASDRDGVQAQKAQLEKQLAETAAARKAFEVKSGKAEERTGALSKDFASLQSEMAKLQAEKDVTAKRRDDRAALIEQELHRLTTQLFVLQSLPLLDLHS